MKNIDMDRVDRVAFSITEAAAALGLGRSSMYALVKDPTFPAVRVSGRILIPVDALRSWLASQATENKPTDPVG